MTAPPRWPSGSARSALCIWSCLAFVTHSLPQISVAVISLFFLFIGVDVFGLQVYKYGQGLGSKYVTQFCFCFF